MDQDEEIAAAPGIALAHTTLITALLTVLRAKGLLTQDDVNTVFDSALTGAETAHGLSAEASLRARRILEILAREMAGEPRP
jgi:hypothetical protein